MAIDNELLLDVKNLTISFKTEQGTARAVDGVSFQVRKGKVLGIVGESGCGKSVSTLSLMRLLPQPAGHIDAGEINYQGENIATLPASRLPKIRGKEIAMIFQEPMTALNPVQKIARQLAEVYELHFPKMTSKEVHNASIAMLEKVGIPDPAGKLDAYPHQLSGGMRQRVMIAIALACEPKILIADEPTTALDVTIQAQILELINQLQKDSGMAVIFITHDLGVIAEISDEVLVMYAGRVVESGSVDQVFSNPCHPYTHGLLRSIPRLDSTPKTVLPTIAGMVPSIFDWPRGCRYENRCPHATSLCREKNPELETINIGHATACHHWQKISADKAKINDAKVLT